MKVYLVGGAVRDILLNEKVNDRDYVVVGATPEQMINNNFIQVQTDSLNFPVFKHPQTNEEYALARTEKLSSQGYPLFSFHTEGVSIEQDLIRRDLTINAIAFEMVDDDVVGHVDPFNGVNDLKNKVLRHISEAFSEDPFRVFRVARFATKFSDFAIADETIEMMRKMVKSEDFKKISPEKVFKEMLYAFQYKTPSIFFNTLKRVGGLDFHFPEISKLIDVPQNPIYHPEGCAYTHTMLVLDHASNLDSNYREIIQFCALVHDLGKGITPKEILPKHIGHELAGLPLVNDFCDRFGVPKFFKKNALVVTEHHLTVHRLKELKPTTVAKLFDKINAYKDSSIVEILSLTCEADEMGKEKVEYENELLKLFHVAKIVSSSSIPAKYSGKQFGERLYELRVNAIKNFRGV